MARNENGKGFSLKDELFNERKVAALGKRFSDAYTVFDDVQFTQTVMKTLLQLELKERIGCITDALREQMPEDFEEASMVLVDVLPEPLDPTKTDNDFGDFIYAPLGEYVARYGCTVRHIRTALATLREITMRFSMEDAIRAFLNAYPKETLATMKQWASDDHYHVRRLVSEGTRPLLPWSGRIGIAQADTIPLLDTLYRDKTRYVTRSVANHLNDIAKEKPELVTQTLKRWRREAKQEEKEMDWITRHALRTLIKQGNTDALQLLGYSPDPHIAVSGIAINRDSVRIGQVIEFSFTITVYRDESLMIDYAVDFMKAGGKRAEKVYKIKKLHLRKGDTVTLMKKHRFPADATTLTLYPGTHAIVLQINGTRHDSVDFELEA